MAGRARTAVGFGLPPSFSRLTGHTRFDLAAPAGPSVGRPVGARSAAGRAVGLGLAGLGAVGAARLASPRQVAVLVRVVVPLKMRVVARRNFPPPEVAGIVAVVRVEWGTLKWAGTRSRLIVAVDMVALGCLSSSDHHHQLDP